MFTGIIERIGKVQNTRKDRDSAVVSIDVRVILEGVRLGDSVTINGVCLAVTSFSQSGFTADVMHETLNRSSLGDLHVGGPVNLEQAMPTSGRFGGYVVSGHINGTGTISVTARGNNAIWYTVKTGPPTLRYIVEKGSVAIDGVSLTVAKAHNDGFGVSIMPHTAAQTILPEERIGDVFSLENDCTAKHVERLPSSQSPKTAVTTEFPAKHGF